MNTPNLDPETRKQVLYWNVMRAIAVIMFILGLSLPLLRLLLG